ncbi:unnamed protein product [Bursaphelenchus xylophilus]|nr:unnamed protein product [Bursaphelenchus xylophilus]CAG9122944.1 unnamed protein product [Bursaphelenchus xylophilus]
MRLPILLCLLVLLSGVKQAAPGKAPSENYDNYKTITFRDEPHPEKLFNLADLFTLPPPPPKQNPAPKKAARKS